MDYKIRIATDSSAAKGITARLGTGRVRHLETRCLWIQQKVHDKELVIVKLSKDVNRADIQTKPLSPAEHSRHVQALPVVRHGWTGCSPQVLAPVLLFALVAGSRADPRSAVAGLNDDTFSNTGFWCYSTLVLFIGIALGFWFRGRLASRRLYTKDCRVQTDFLDVEAYWEWSAVEIGIGPRPVEGQWH